MGLNDPQWGSKNSGGPPDLDELIRNLNKKIANLFGVKGGSGNGGGKDGGPGSSPGFGVSVVLILSIVAALWLASGFYIVQEGSGGVVLRFGGYVETTPPGPRWHMPYPIESVEVVSISSVRTVEIGYRENVKNKVVRESLMLTADENIIDIQFAVQYFLKHPKEYLFNNRRPDENVRQAAETAIREIVGKNKMDFVLYEGREQVAAATTELIQSILDRYETGILVSKVTMQNAQPPEQVQAAFDDAVKAGQDRERQKNEGQSYANDVVPRAVGAAARLKEESEGYRQRVIANAEGDASRFKQVLVEYEKAPGVTRERMYIDTMQQIMTSSTKVLVDQKAGNNLLYLPLDKLIQSTGQPLPESMATTSTEPVAAPTATTSEALGLSRTRETMRGRDREAR
jgi:modulator of FtsH protease HflK